MENLVLLFMQAILCGASGSPCGPQGLSQQPGSAASITHGVSLMQKSAVRNVVASNIADNDEWFASDSDADVSLEEADAYVLTWEVPAALHAPPGISALEAQQHWKRWINVTALEARQMTGPLSLLLALRICEGAKALKPVLEKAFKKGEVRIHLLGVQDKIEPKMAWKRFLVGPLTNRDQLLVNTFGLPYTPLAGLNVSLLFSGDEFDSSASGDLKGAFTEVHTSGLYHKTVKEIPDLAVALNPGFPHYLGNWWPTLRRLWSARVPIIATGYGHSFGTGFAVPALYNLGYDAEGHLKTPLLDNQATLMRTHISDPGANAICAESKRFVGLPKKDGTLCSDRQGNALIADHAGADRDSKPIRVLQPAVLL
eukprot:gnl/MRDRNA2_/MRDRNA2_125492_c0_seq1.p1 gnl/MRDRNA2_/MRDRNA2_125492_c0~~gnl/MRDRNA2_/MRDRNA2_125492_c0_seq1.p1  ORF type:complete len:370 (-),score=63.54 gnl/MRDRNA2_/MRDRNA2_125492_c0_seq1:396-1505(-)